MFLQYKVHDVHLCLYLHAVMSALLVPTVSSGKGWHQTNLYRNPVCTESAMFYTDTLQVCLQRPHLVEKNTPKRHSTLQFTTSKDVLLKVVSYIRRINEQHQEN